MQGEPLRSRVGENESLVDALNRERQEQTEQERLESEIIRLHRAQERERKLQSKFPPDGIPYYNKN